MNNNDISYKNYGGRGIKFCFETIEEATKWVFNNLGPCPKGCSIYRIDNNQNYEPGNLRWATKEEQARNKHGYLGSVYGYRLKKLTRLRPDYTYEGLRKYIKMGWSDEQIISLKKPISGRPRKDVSTSL